MRAVHKWGAFEVEFNSKTSHADPFRTVTLNCVFKAPSGRTLLARGFWDEGSTWRVRFMPDEIGVWTYATACSNRDDGGLHNQTGSFKTMPYEGDNPLYVHGPLRLSGNRRYLIHTDGTPFFWLADTAWHGAIKSTLNEWNAYLKVREEQGFTAVQFVTTHWRGGPLDSHGEKAYEGKDRIQSLNVAFFKRLDPKFPALNEHGLVAAPVLLWAAAIDIDPGRTLAEEDATQLAQYLTARYGAYVLVWILGGDGRYTGEDTDRWRRIGRGVFPDKNRHPVAMHLCGKHWILPEFQHEEWLDIIGYQSGHGVDEDTLKWLCQGPPSRDWLLEPARPIINLEPNYEAHLAYHIHTPITPHQVRRATCWSLLTAPTAGVSYGTNGVWSWARKPEVPINHPHVGVAQPWRKTIKLPGVEAVCSIKKVFSEMPWWTLLPDQSLLAEQPGLQNIERFVVAARTEDRKAAVLYAPQEQEIDLSLTSLQGPLEVTWINPTTGEKTTRRQVNAGSASMKPPEPGDWILILASSLAEKLQKKEAP